MRSDFEQKRAARIERFNRLAEKNQEESEARFNAATKLGKMIPMGQPILVGHHSEKGHRAHLERINTNMRKSIEADKKAAYYADKAEASEKNNAISSDDPTALDQLREKLERLQRNQELMKSCNKILRSKKIGEAEMVEKLVALGLHENTAIKIMEPTYGRMGLPSYKLTNNNANISTLKKRIAKLEAMESMETEEKTFGDIKIVENVEENRVQIFFPDKPSQEVRTELKRGGFRWSPTNGCWQAFYSNASKWKAEQIVKNQTENN